MARQNHLFSVNTRVSDIVDTDPALLDVFLRLGVTLGFGESTVDEVCTRHGLDALTVCLICNVYSFDGYDPAPETIARGHVTDVIRYLKNSHRHYMSSELVELEEAIRKLIAPFGSSHQKVIRRFFSEYKQELEKHFGYEEGEVFSYIQALLFGRDTRGFSIDKFEENHSNVDEKLSDLKNLVMKTLPSMGPDEDRAALLRMLYRLQRDLVCHTAVEDRILTPMVRYLEHPQSFRTEESHAPSERNDLTEREKEILVSVACGKLNKEIADQYNISIHTVISHRKNITRKTGIKTVAGLTVYALLNGLIDTDSVE